MIFRANKTALAAAMAMTASVGLALPAAASPYHNGYRHAHHASAYREGYRRGFRAGHIAAVEPGVATGRSAYVEQGPIGAANNGVFGNGGVLGLGILGGNGLLGTGMLNGQGARGLGIGGL